MIRDCFTDWSPLPLRLVMGGRLACHGFVKLSSRRGHENIVSLLRQTGAPLPEAAGWAVGLYEFFGGLCIVAGVRTRLNAQIVIGEVAFNLANALRRGGYPVPLPGGEPLPDTERSLFYGACALSLLATGPGRLSCDRAAGRRLGG
jgi:putative oxidoreductase